jgi:putative addiction module killer protein
LQAVRELRIDLGPGYRVYYARVGKAVVLLLCAGDKRKQQADIKRAKEYLDDYLERQESRA